MACHLIIKVIFMLIIELINVGRSKINRRIDCHSEYDLDNLFHWPQIETFVLREVKKCLTSNEIELIENKKVESTDSVRMYKVVAGIGYHVGDVVLIQK